MWHFAASHVATITVDSNVLLDIRVSSSVIETPYCGLHLLHFHSKLLVSQMDVAQTLWVGWWTALGAWKMKRHFMFILYRKWKRRKGEREEGRKGEREGGREGGRET